MRLALVMFAVLGIAPCAAGQTDEPVEWSFSAAAYV